MAFWGEIFFWLVGWLVGGLVGLYLIKPFFFFMDVNFLGICRFWPNV